MPSSHHGLPRISIPIVRGFRWFARRYVRKHFHALAINREQLNVAELTPLDSIVVYANHASWWDPLTALLLAEEIFPAHGMYAPIDAEALNKYRMFAKMGFYPVEQNGSWRGAASFLKTSIAILEHGGTSLWITPEGRFVDVRDTSAEFTMGLSHLAFEATRRPSLATASAGSTQDQSSRRIWFVSAAVEYTFWEERLPELLVWFGRPLSTDDTAGMTKNEVHLELMRRMRAAQQELASASIKRDSSQFEILLGGTSGTFVVYDIWRRLKASLTGKKIRVDHSQKLSNEP